MNAKLIGFKDRYAVIEMESGDTIKWPIKYLPDSANPGDEIELRLITKNGVEAERVHAMKQMLKELIN